MYLGGIELVLKVVDDVAVGDALQWGLAEVRLEGRQDLVRIVDEVQHKGLGRWQANHHTNHHKW